MADDGGAHRLSTADHANLSEVHLRLLRIELGGVLSTFSKLSFLLAGAFGGVGPLVFGGVSTALCAAAVAGVFACLGGRMRLTSVCPWSVARLRVYERRVVIEATNAVVVLERDDVTSGMVVQREVEGRTAYVVELLIRPRLRAIGRLRSQRGDRLEIRIEDLAAAHRLLAALGFAGPRAHSGVSLATSRGDLVPFAVLVFGLLVGVCTSVVLVSALDLDRIVSGMCVVSLAPIVAIAVLGLARLPFAPVRVAIGRDIVTVSRGLRTHTFARCRITTSQVVEIRDRLFFGFVNDQERARAIANILPLGSCDRDIPEARLDTYGRSGRSVARWRESIEEAFPPSSYRSGAVEEEEAFAVLTSPMASVDQRVGAALALRLAGVGDKGIRIANESIVATGTRELIKEVVQASNDADVEKALARVR